jgi:hypothetical protein
MVIVDRWFLGHQSNQRNIIKALHSSRDSNRLKMQLKQLHTAYPRDFKSKADVMKFKERDLGRPHT